MSIEKLVEFRIFQIDIILCWIAFVFKVLIFPCIISTMFVIEHKLSKDIRKRDARMRLHRRTKIC